MSSPLVSIVIPCFNAATTIERCLHSCVDQHYRDLEIIVVDNNSSDDSRALIKRFANAASRPVTLLNNARQGVNMTRNVGLMAARGEYIQLLDADDTLSEDKIARQVDALEANNDFAFAYGDWYWRFDTPSSRTDPDVLVRASQYDDMLLQLLIDNWRPPHCYLARRSALVSIAPLARLSRHTHIATDREYMTLAAMLGMRFLYVADSPVRYYTWSSTQITRSSGRAARAESLVRIFRRLQRYARTAPAVALNATHRHLLQQDRRLWRTAADPGPGDLERTGVIRSAIFHALRAADDAFTLEHGARFAGHHFMSWQLRAILVAGRDPDLGAVQRSLSRWLAGNEEHVRHVSIPDPVVLAPPQRLWGYLVNGPFFAPKNAEQRWLIFQHMERMAAEGLLVAA